MKIKMKFSQNKKDLLAHIAKHSLKVSDKNEFKLSSGHMSNFVIDLSLSLRDTTGARLLRNVLGEEYGSTIPHVNIGGPSSGADPIAAAFLQIPGVSSRWFSVRKAPKGHGFDIGPITGPLYSGHPHINILCEDVLTSGASLMAAYIETVKLGLRIDQFLVLVDRQEFGGLVKLKKLGINTNVIFTAQDIFDCANGFLN